MTNDMSEDERALAVYRVSNEWPQDTLAPCVTEAVDKALLVGRASLKGELEAKDAEIAALKRLAIVPLEGEYLEQMNQDGFWHSCSGCHSTNEGASTGWYPTHPFFNCERGGGCQECGYIGVVWDNIDYAGLHAEFALDAKALKETP